MADTVWFDGYDFGEKFIIGDVQRPLPEFRIASTQVDGVDGEMMDGFTVGPRTCSFTVSATAAGRWSLQALARELADVLLVREPKALMFTDERDPSNSKDVLYRHAVPDGTFDFEEFVRAGRWTLRFRQPDPYLYGKSCSVHLFSNVAKEVVVGGNAPAKLVAKMKPQNGKTSCTLKAGGLGFVKYRAAFDGQTELTLDFASQYARLSKSITAEGLVAGSRFFEFDGRPMMQADAPTDLSWRERWI
jgi:predicted phage tail component-like protein